MAGRVIRRAMLAATLLALAGLILPPFVNVGRYKSRVVESMSEALGRPVTCGSLELRLLPRPGFYLDNVTIGDDPAYSAEPILYADDVTAYLSIRSLWRGRIEFSRLALEYPSLNLVEGAHGGWNLESLLWKASQARTSPTGAGRGAARPRFPYIEASNGRINFKYGLSKSVFSFDDANFSLWSPAEDQWRMRIEARPIRTDMPVTDTGVVRADVTVRRAPQLRDAPINSTLSWENVQMGNLTRLLSGKDRGWRGALEGHAQISGTPRALHVSTAATVSDLRRYDIIGGESSTLRTSCEGVFDLPAEALDHGICRLPLDGGTLAVEGAVSGLHTPQYDLTLTAENLGAATLLNLARRAEHNLPDDLSAGGTISASFHISRLNDAPSTWIGNLGIHALDLHSAMLGKDLSVAQISAEINTSAPLAGRHPQHAQHLPPQRALQLQSFGVPLGGNTPATVDGSLDGRNFTLHVKGDATLQRLQQVARTLGIGAPKLSLTGAAAIDLTLNGQWASLDSPQLSGIANLKNIRAEVPGVAAPIEISTGRAEFEGDRFTLRSSAASIGRVTLAGSAVFPRSCGSDSPCLASFDLSTDELNLAHWNEVLNPHLKKKPWYEFGGGSGNNVMAALNATGELHARRLTIESTDGSSITGSNFVTSFSLANGVMQWRDARVEMFGGAISGDWKLDWSGDKPNYEGSGVAEQVQTEKLAALLGASPGSGMLELQYSLRMSGEDEASLDRSASAEVKFHWSGGSLRLAPDGHSALRVLEGEGSVALGKKGWTISDSQWRTPGKQYRLSGSISRSSDVDVEFSRQDGSLTRLQGSLSKPQVVAPSARVSRRAR